MMSDMIAGTYTPTTGASDAQIKQDALEQINSKLFAEGKGIISNSSLIGISHNNDGSVTWSYNLDTPKRTGSLKDFNKSMEKLDQMLSTGDGLSDASEVMAEFFKISHKLRQVADKSDKALIKQQVDKLKAAASDLRKSADWALAAGIVMGSAQCIAGAADIAGSLKMGGSLNEATDLSSQAMRETKLARMGRAPSAPEPELEIGSNQKALRNNANDDAGDEIELKQRSDNEDEPNVSQRKNANADQLELNSNEQQPKLNLSKKSRSQQMQELEEKNLQQKSEANEEEMDFDQARAAKVETLNRQAEIKLRGISGQEAFVRGVGGMSQGIGGILKAIGDQQSMYAQSDSKIKEAEATADAAHRDAMLKFRDSSNQAMQAALQGMQQLTQIETDMVKKTFA